MVPRLVDSGAEVFVAGSGRTLPPQDKQWLKARYVACDLSNPAQLKNLKDLSPEIVVEMPGHAWNVYQEFKSVARHIIACGSLWMYGLPRTVPTPEQTQAPCPFESYKERYSDILRLCEISRKDGLAFTAIMPPNISGPGKIPLDCSGDRNLAVHKAHAAGKEVILPDGPEVLIGPCDADDIAACFVNAVFNRDKAAHQIFNVGAEYALTASEFVLAYAQIYNVSIPVKTLSWQEYVKSNPDIGAWWHFKAHMCPDITKAKRLLNYQPRFTPQQSLQRAVEWMKTQKLL
jgi:nucleoside-diphosphate-sugar epimerase